MNRSAASGMGAVKLDASAAMNRPRLSQFQIRDWVGIELKENGISINE